MRQTKASQSQIVLRPVTKICWSVRLFDDVHMYIVGKPENMLDAYAEYRDLSLRLVSPI